MSVRGDECRRQELIERYLGLLQEVADLMNRLLVDSREMTLCDGGEVNSQFLESAQAFEGMVSNLLLIARDETGRIETEMRCGGQQVAAHE